MATPLLVVTLPLEKRPTKPVKEEKLCSVLDCATEKLSKNEKVLNFEIGGEMVRVSIYQIRYADVFGNYVTIHALCDVTVKMTLGELEKQLEAQYYTETA